MKKGPSLPKNGGGKNIIIEQKKRRLEIKIKLKAKMIVLKRESVFNPQLLVLEFCMCPMTEDGCQGLKQYLL